MTEAQAIGRLYPVKKKEAMPSNARTVKAFLMRSSASTAIEIMYAIGISHADVYRALVWLEARGLAFVYVRPGLGGYWDGV